METKPYYELVREKDQHIVTGAFFKSVTIYEKKDNEYSEFPPKVGDSIIVFNNIFHYWQTTQIREVIEVSKDEYKFITQNSTYSIKRKEL